MKSRFRKIVVMVLVLAVAAMPIAFVACSDGGRLERQWFENSHVAFSQIRDAFNAEGYAVSVVATYTQPISEAVIVKLSASQFFEWFEIRRFDCTAKATNFYNVIYPRQLNKGKDGQWVWVGTENSLAFFNSMKHANNIVLKCYNNVSIC